VIYVLLLIGFICLIGGGNLLVDGSVAVANKLKVSPLLIGLVLVGFGTSAPELATSLLANYRQAGGIAVGNVIGSNIANILLVLGVAALLRAIPVQKKSFKRDSLFLAFSTFILILALLCGTINTGLGILMCAVLLFYIGYSYKTEKKDMSTDQPTSSQKDPKDPDELDAGLLLSILKTIAGIALTLCGANLLVNNSVILASQWGVSETIIGLTVIAVGTSLPELATSIIASIKNQSDLALGNVIGSNIFNALFILGLTAVFMPIDVPSDIIPDMIFMILATVLLIAFGLKGKLSKINGILFVALYIVYIVYLVYSA